MRGRGGRKQFGTRKKFLIFGAAAVFCVKMRLTMKIRVFRTFCESIAFALVFALGALFAGEDPDVLFSLWAPSASAAADSDVVVPAAPSVREDALNRAFCEEADGEVEFRVDDGGAGKVRVDCLLDDYVVEMDFADKWAEAFGQSVYYSYLTGRNAAVVLIKRPGASDRAYAGHLRRFRALAHYAEQNVLVVCLDASAKRFGCPLENF